MSDTHTDLPPPQGEGTHPGSQEDGLEDQSRHTHLQSSIITVYNHFIFLTLYLVATQCSSSVIRANQPKQQFFMLK